MDFVKIFEDTVRDLKREVDKVVLKVPEIELKVLDATNHEPWGPHGSALVELAQATKNYNECQMIMNVLWKRLAETGRNWRHVYKALTVLEYLMAHGAERVIEDINEHSYQLSGLLEFEYVEPNGKDQGINVRKKSQNLIALIRDKDKIQEVRQKAVANRNKYCGLSSTGGYKPSSYSGIVGGYSSYDDDFGGPFRKSEEDSDKFKTDKYGEKYNEKSSDGKSIGNSSSDQFVDDDDFAKLRDHGDVKYSSMHDHNNIDAYSPRVESSVPNSKDETHIKPSIGSASVYTDDDFDDFDPRGTSTAGVGAVASADTADDDLFGSFSSNPAAGPTNNTTFTTSATFTGQISPPPSATNSFVPTSITPPPSATKSFISTTTSNSQEMDFFSTATAPTTASSANSSLIGVTGDANSNVDLFAGATFVEAPAATSTNSLNQINDDLLSQDFLTGQASASNVSGNVNLFDGDFIDAIGTTSSTENEAFEAEKPNLTTTTKAEPGKDKFQPKSSIWADSLSRGLVDLNLSEPKKVSLADIGIVLDTSTPPKKDLESRPSFTMRMGKAMGSGSGRGRVGGSTLSANSSSSVENTGVTALGMNPLTNLFESKQETPATMASGAAMNFPLNFPTGSGQTGLNNQSQNFGRFS